jgi:hypothetical protein
MHPKGKFVKIGNKQTLLLRRFIKMTEKENELTIITVTKWVVKVIRNIFLQHFALYLSSCIVSVDAWEASSELNPINRLYKTKYEFWAKRCFWKAKQCRDREKLWNKGKAWFLLPSFNDGTWNSIFNNMLMSKFERNNEKCIRKSVLHP